MVDVASSCVLVQAGRNPGGSRIPRPRLFLSLLWFAGERGQRPPFADFCVTSASHLTCPVAFESIQGELVRITIISVNPFAPWGGSEELWSQAALELLGAGAQLQLVRHTWNPEPAQVQAIRAAGAASVPISSRPDGLALRVLQEVRPTPYRGGRNSPKGESSSRRSSSWSPREGNMRGGIGWRLWPTLR